jgi:transcriptional regulator CtsR
MKKAVEEREERKEHVDIQRTQLANFMTVPTQIIRSFCQLAYTKHNMFCSM